MVLENPKQASSTRPENDHVPIYIFRREGDGWFIDLPEYLARGGHKQDLQLVEGADVLLDFMAKKKAAVALQLDTEPFEGADVLELVELCDAPKGGGYYALQTFRNRVINKTIWLCDVTLFLFGDMPERIYIKKHPFKLSS